MPNVPGFKPSATAPLFSNSTGWPPKITFPIEILGMRGDLSGEGFGLCGGMAYLARDIHEAGTGQLTGTDSRMIPRELALHIWQRLLDSFGPDERGWPTHLKWQCGTQALDHGTVFGGPGLFALSVREVPKVTSEIDAGKLCPIGVFLVHSWWPWHILLNHVQLVYGYDRNGDVLRFHVYDCNAPGDDGKFIELDIGSERPAKSIFTNATEWAGHPGQIRGFFRMPYKFVDPSPAYIDRGDCALTVPPPVQMSPGGSASIEVGVWNRGTTTWPPNTVDVVLKSSLWGVVGAALTGSLAPGSRGAVRMTVIAPVVVGKYDFGVEVHKLGHPLSSCGRQVSVGDTSALLCQELHRRHVSMVKELEALKKQREQIDWTDDEAGEEARDLAQEIKFLQLELRDLEREQVGNNCAPG